MDLCVYLRSVKDVTKIYDKYYELTLELYEYPVDPRPICPFCNQRGMDLKDKKKGNLIYNICKRCGEYWYEYE